MQHTKNVEKRKRGKLGNKEKPKYENYLKDLKVKKDDGSQWKKIMKNDKISEEDKDSDMLLLEMLEKIKHRYEDLKKITDSSNDSFVKKNDAPDVPENVANNPQTTKKP